MLDEDFLLMMTERFHQDFMDMERRHRGRWNVNTVGDCCWTLREVDHISPDVSKTTVHEAVTDKFRVQKILGTLGAKNVNGQSKNETDGFCAEVSHAL
jgi:hypothetical protein